MNNKIKFYGGWLLIWLPLAGFYMLTKPFAWLNDKIAWLCNVVDDYLLTFYTFKKIKKPKNNEIVYNIK